MVKESKDVDISKLVMDIYQLLKDLDSEKRKKVVNATMVLFGEDNSSSQTLSEQIKVFDEQSREPIFSQRKDLPPKEFLLEKEPHTEVDRVTCLAYYLHHFRDMTKFKTINISQLNTEAAQLKLSNPTKAIENASIRGLIVPVSRGFKQISAIGEKFVDSLPNYDEAKKITIKYRPKKRKSGEKKK